MSNRKLEKGAGVCHNAAYVSSLTVHMKCMGYSFQKAKRLRKYFNKRKIALMLFKKWMFSIRH
ncbi:hypothetical protein BIY37_05420 [Candidatus Brocadia sapporoensis]|uniref:Uncharacterized protein n=1 Tax=Candidatus Brocadia sapporoensis TaxID=392547 RepID=A0A1V6M103_9BACT|nr:hypothetical protein BIY37_05420 [Candidatus Brocadia sapporoensis]